MAALTTKGEASGLATLDGDGKLTASEIPDALAAIAAQGAAVADAAALTASAVGALTSAQLTGGESPTEAEHNALQTDVATVRTKLNQAIVDITAIRTTVNALLASLRTAGVIDT